MNSIQVKTDEFEGTFHNPHLLQVKTNIIKTVVDMVLVGNTYNPEYLDVGILSALVGYSSDQELPRIGSDDTSINMNVILAWVESGVVNELIGVPWYDKLVSEINQKIEFEKQILIRNRENAEIMATINNVATKANEMVESLSSILKPFADSAIDGEGKSNGIDYGKVLGLLTKVLGTDIKK